MAEMHLKCLRFNQRPVFFTESRLLLLVNVMKVTLRRTLHAASGGVKLTPVITPLDGSVGVKYGRRNVL